MRKIACRDLRSWLRNHRGRWRMPWQNHHLSYRCPWGSLWLEPSKNLQIPNQIGPQIEACSWMYHHPQRSLSPQILFSPRSRETPQNQMVFGPNTRSTRWDIRWIWGSWRTLSWWKSNWWSCPPILRSPCFHQLWSSPSPIPKIKTATPTPSRGQKSKSFSNNWKFTNSSPPDLFIILKLSLCYCTLFCFTSTQWSILTYLWENDSPISTVLCMALTYLWWNKHTVVKKITGSCIILSS